MKKLILIIAALSLIAPFSKAQYSLMTKGQLCPFDTAVAIHVNTYRLESRKLNLGDGLISNLKEQLKVSMQVNASLSNQLDMNKEMLKVREQQLEMKNKQMDLLINNYYPKPKDSWFRRNEKTIYFVGGIITGGLVVYVIK